MTGHLHDPDDFCRMCRGRGRLSHDRGGTEPCWRCDGTGTKTVLVFNDDNDLRLREND